MQMKTTRHRPAAILPFLWLALVAGCASEPQTAKQQAAEEEYVYITVTGSNIPKRIKKSDILNGDLPKDGDAQMVDKDQFMKSLRPGRKIERGS